MSAFAKYRKILEIGLQNTVVYRWNFLLRILFDVIPLIGTVFLWRAIFNARRRPIEGYDFGAMVYYFLLTIVASNLVTPTDDEWQIAAEIREGQLNSLLVKPLDHLSYRASLFIGYRLTFSLITLPIVILIFACFHRYIVLPMHFTTWIFAGLSLMMAAVIQFLLAYMVAMLAFWILEISTVVFIIFSFEYFLSGHLFPLDLLPGWMHATMIWLPFTYELYFPLAVFQEKVSGDALFVGLAIQSGWAAVAFLSCRILWVRGLRRYQAYGG